MMNTLARYIALFILGILLAMPVITLHGSLHLALLVVCAMLLGKRLFEPGIWQLCALGAYGLFIGYFYVAGFDELKQINSQQMRQVSVMLLAFLAMRDASLREIHALFAFILLTAAVGVLGEMAGLNMHAFLPAKVMEQEYYNDAMFLAGGIQRFRGFFTESSILLAVTTSFAFIAAVGTIAAWRDAFGRRFIAAATLISVVAVLFLLAVALAKTGLVIALAGGFGIGMALLLNLRREHLPPLIAGLLGVTFIVIIAAIFLPSTVREYITDEISAVPLALEGNKAVETTSGGLLTRIECWRLALETVRNFPFGVGLFGVERAYFSSKTVMLTGELELLFRLGIFGLKNTIANVLAQTGVPGMVLLLAALFQAFIRPLRVATRNGASLGAGLSAIYLASLCIAIFFLASCETYFWMAFIVVLKCYADAAVREREFAVETDAADGLLEVLTPA